MTKGQKQKNILPSPQMSTGTAQNSGTGNRAPNGNGRASRTGPTRRDNGQHSKRYVKGKNSRPSLRIDDELLLAESMPQNGRRGINISHLMQFSIADEADRELEWAGSAGHHGYRRNSFQKPRKAAPSISLSGRDYINVNYRFVVDYRRDYKAQILDPSLPLEDDTIFRVIVNGKDYQCPICLGDEFIAPRMTRCGHVFCYPCLLRLLVSSSDAAKEKSGQDTLPGRRSAACPLCNETIWEKHRLLPVLISNNEEKKPTPGEVVDLTLMYRPSSRVFTQPFRFYLEDSYFQRNIPWIERGSTVDNFYSNSRYTRYSRLMKCDMNFVLSCFEEELSSVEAHKSYDKEVYQDSGLYYDLARVNIEAQRKAVEEALNEPSSQSATPRPEIPALTPERMEELYAKQPTFRLPEGDVKGYFFYQFDAGPNCKVKYFLAALDVQILKTMYGEFSNFPFFLRLRLENISYEDGMVTDELIQKVKYLGHLPIGTELAFLELDWAWAASNGMIPPEVYSRFKKRVKDRSRRTRSRKLKEDKNKKTYDRELELKTLQFYSSENNLPLEEYGYRKMENQFASISEDAVQPSLEDAYSAPPPPTAANSDADGKYITSVWGTQVPLTEEEAVRQAEDAFEVERMIQKAKDEQGKGKGKKKHKKIVLSFN